MLVVGGVGGGAGHWTTTWLERTSPSSRPGRIDSQNQHHCGGRNYTILDQDYCHNMVSHFGTTTVQHQMYSHTIHTLAHIHHHHHQVSTSKLAVVLMREGDSKSWGKTAADRQIHTLEAPPLHHHNFKFCITIIIITLSSPFSHVTINVGRATIMKLNGWYVIKFSSTHCHSSERAVLWRIWCWKGFRGLFNFLHILKKISLCYIFAKT